MKPPPIPGVSQLAHDKFRLSLACLVPLAALSLQLLAWQFVQPYVWFFFYPAVFLSSWLGGLRGGLVATVLSTVIVWWVFVPARYSFNLEQPASALAMSIFAVMGALFSYTHERLRKASRQTAEALASANAAKEHLEEQVGIRTAELVRTIEELRSSEAKFRQTLDSMLEGCQIIGFDWRYLYINAAAEAHNRRSSYELLGKTVMECWPGITETEVFALEKRCLEERTTHRLNNELIYPDGQRGWFRLIIQPVPEGLVIFSEDVTLRKRAEGALGESERRLKMFIEHAPAALAMFDRQMCYLAVSRRWLDDFGLGQWNILGQSHYAVFPEIGADWKSVHQRGMSGEIVRIDENRFVRANGSEQWLRWEVRPWHTAEGETGGIVIFSEDISEQHLAEQERLELIAQLARRNAELERFTYTVSHDLKSPLITILGFIGQLEHDLRAHSTENIENDLTFIRGAAEQMNELLNSLLHLSRAGRAIGEPRSINFPELVRQVAEQVGGQFPRLRVQFIAPPDFPELKGDPMRLREVMQNLLGNAAKFTAGQAEPSVGIECVEMKGEVLCHVHDNGIGIPEEHQEKVFGLFDKLDPTSEGTGIGLAIVRRIVEEHGGRVWVESAGKGCGSTFSFTLPTVFQ